MTGGLLSCLDFWCRWREGNRGGSRGSQVALGKDGGGTGALVASGRTVTARGPLESGLGSGLGARAEESFGTVMRDREAEPAGRTTPALLHSNIKGSSR